VGSQDGPTDGLGWREKRGVTPGRAESEFDLFLTADKNLRYQQNLKGRRLAILVLPSNRLKVLRSMIQDIEVAIAQVVPGKLEQYCELPQVGE
jgi:hypothetical protein